MSFSCGDFDDDIVRWAANALAHSQRILDMGCGAGKYGHLLGRMKPEMEGVDLDPAACERFDLLRWYRRVSVADMATWDIPANRYSLVIIGDALEHLATDAAQRVIERAVAAAPLVLVVVPFMSPESGDRGPGGAHLQGDLSPETVAARYPTLRLWLCNERIGVYFAGARAERELRLLRGTR